MVAHPPVGAARLARSTNDDETRREALAGRAATLSRSGVPQMNIGPWRQVRPGKYGARGRQTREQVPGRTGAGKHRAGGSP
ncbi:hypothetical protein KFL01_20960 [Kocuria flava]|uniref:Uncharacterized protein n=1 Tax=Kocuria flava TaxID=446860 RepID=A0ABQ0X632_9MICC|nr:hypothetical protein KFL01_20960 [Kocuria flava]